MKTCKLCGGRLEGYCTVIENDEGEIYKAHPNCVFAMDRMCKTCIRQDRCNLKKEDCFYDNIEDLKYSKKRRKLNGKHQY